MKTKILGLLALGLLAAPSHAAIWLTMEEVGSNVVMSGSGTANLADLTFANSTGGSTGSIRPEARVAVLGAPGGEILDFYCFASGPSSFGSGGVTFGTIGSGDNFGLFFTACLAVPQHYVSGALLAGTTTFANTSFAALGVTPGLYVWNWGSGENADSFTLQIGQRQVPEPGTLALLGLGLAGLGLSRRRKAV